MKSLTETSRKRYASASVWIFSMETFFLTNFKGFLDTRSGCPFPSALFPLFIGEKREVVAAELTQTSWVAFTKRHRLLSEQSGRPKWAWLLFAPPFSLSTPPWCFFIDFFSETLRNFMDYATMLVFPSGMLRNFTDYAMMLVSPSGMLRNFTNYATMLVFPSGMLRHFTDYAMMLVSRVLKGANKVQGPTASTPGWN